MTNLFFHGGAVDMDHEGPLGSVMYDLMGEHRVALGAMALALIAAVIAIRFGRGSIFDAYRRLSLRHRAAALLLLIDGAAHAGLVLTATGGWKVVFLASAVGTGWIIWRLLQGKPWRRLAGLLLGGALVGYWIELLRGHPVDQIGLTVKLIEIVALSLVLEPAKAKWRPLRRMVATTVTAGALLFNTAFAWAGAFGGDRAEASAPLDHHVGAMVTPGMVMLPHNVDDATALESGQAEALWEATAIATAEYADPAVAAAAGYRVEGLAGDDFHAPNPLYQNDGRMLDAARPENLVYAMGPEGPVLMGVMFETEGLRNDPPAAGGPLLHWHRHEQVCFSILPFGLAGLVDPQGMCPAGSLALPTTGSMMHVWTVPGAPQQFGDLDEVWKRTFLDSLGA